MASKLVIVLIVSALVCSFSVSARNLGGVVNDEKLVVIFPGEGGIVGEGGIIGGGGEGIVGGGIGGIGNVAIIP